ncbi:MAG: hypothetical protein ACPKPY_13125 [Nitrososphaeraceae archaeon]
MLITTIAIIGVIMAIYSEITIPLAFSQAFENENIDNYFLLKARIIVKDSSTQTIEVKLKSQNIVQEQFYDRSIDDNSQTLLKFKFNEAFNAPYEICAESVQEKYVYACKGGLLYDLRPNVTLTL